MLDDFALGETLITIINQKTLQNVLTVFVSCKIGQEINLIPEEFLFRVPTTCIADYGSVGFLRY